MHPYFHIDAHLLSLADAATKMLAPRFAEIDLATEFNQQKVLAAFLRHRVSETHFAGSTGYGYGDRGRETLEAVFAEAVGAEAALVRHTFTCGTHTLAAALFGLLRPGDTMLCATGTPYDTLHSVIGLKGEGLGSLRDFGIHYRQVELDAQGRLDLDAIAAAVEQYRPKLVYFQRSRGYTLRPSLSVAELAQAAALVKSRADAVVMADNCYGEFVETEEPTARGVDLIAGSLIKNPGGGLAQNGGYIAGRRALVELCAHRMTAPGLGGEVGATLGVNRSLFMGLFHAPHVVGEALKTAAFTAALFESLGFAVTPRPLEPRHDIIQAIQLGTPEALIAFCQGMQSGAPVDAFVKPEPWDMPGYDSKVIMAAGAFIMGASIELSADAPLREPYAAWMQGGLNFHSAKTGVLLGAQSMLERGLLP
ncbi:MAG: methionine gamma-lyase family protein [Oscillospiraceae bacterium]|jgi:cystathionine beta-lyase family protein involved in aluminum resistance|nr:methionine gamma-lyase family protein [Oscillospiraceae bacterium]